MSTKSTKSPVKERLTTFAKSQCRYVAEFERRCGLGESFVSGIRKAPSQQKIDQIVKVFPKLNVDWLMTGEGEMLLNVPWKSQGGELIEVPEEIWEEFRRMSETISAQQRTISALTESLTQLLGKAQISAPSISLEQGGE